MKYYNEYTNYTQLIGNVNFNSVKNKISTFFDETNLIYKQCNNYSTSMTNCTQGLELSNTSMNQIMNSIIVLEKKAGQVFYLTVDKCIKLQDLLKQLKLKNEQLDSKNIEYTSAQNELLKIPRIIQAKKQIIETEMKENKNDEFVRNPRYSAQEKIVNDLAAECSRLNNECKGLSAQIDLIISALKGLNNGDISTVYSSLISSNEQITEIPNITGYDYIENIKYTFVVNNKTNSITYSLYIPKFSDPNYKPQVLLYFPGSNQMDSKGKGGKGKSQLEQLLTVGNDSPYYECPYIVLTIHDRLGTKNLKSKDAERTADECAKIIDEVYSKYNIPTSNKVILYGYSFGTNVAPYYIKNNSSKIDYACLGGTTKNGLIALQSPEVLQAVTDNQLRVILSTGKGDPNYKLFSKLPSNIKGDNPYIMDTVANDKQTFMHYTKDEQVTGYYGKHGAYNEQYVIIKNLKLESSNEKYPSYKDLQ